MKCLVSVLMGALMMCVQSAHADSPWTRAWTAWDLAGAGMAPIWHVSLSASKQAAGTLPAQASANKKAPVSAPPVAAAEAPKASVLTTLAAGVGLTWLAASLGLGESMGTPWLIGALAVLLVLVAGVWWFKRQARDGAATGRLVPREGAGAVGGNGLGKDYSPLNVGNDASARPWERQSMTFEVSRFSEGEAASAGAGSGGANRSMSRGVPADFDVEGFLRASKTNFVSLQAAWDRADIAQLRSMMTDDMLAQIQVQLVERERQARGAVNVTEVVMLEAHLLGIEELQQGYIASVEFSGMIREDPSAGPNPFREVWNISRAKGGDAGWLVAGVQALQ